MKPIRISVALLLVAIAVAAAPALAGAAPLSIKVEGNHFVDGEGQTIRLLGVNTPSSEYACAQGYAIADDYFFEDPGAKIAAWNANAVRVPLNEDCWLGTPNLPNPSYGGAAYRAAIEKYVAELNAHGLYAILDLHWSAPGNQLAGEQQPMPDKLHSVPFWEGVANAFKGNPAVVFDLFNEPFDPTDPRSGDDQTESDKVTWECWESGTKPDPIGGGAPPEPCYTSAYGENGNRTGTTYEIAGMQTLIDAVRGTGATQPIMVGGLNYANDLTGWNQFKPTDPLGQLAASFHNYQGLGKCDDVSCWNSEIAPVAANVPVVTGEFAEDNYEASGCKEAANDFDNEYMGWADEHGVSYLAWAWIVPDAPQAEESPCSRFYLLSDYSGTPASPNGFAVHSHLLTLPPGGRAVAPGGGSGSGGSTVPGSTGGGGSVRVGTGPAAIKLTHFSAAVETGGAAVAFRLEVGTSCKLAITGLTAKPFALGGRKKRKVALGSAAANLVAGKAKTVVLQLPAKARGLLRSKGSLPAVFTLALSAGGSTTTSPQTVTLKEPTPKKHHKH